jgi:hypothetical protein
MFLPRASKMLAGRLDEASGCDMVHVAIWGFGRGVVVSYREKRIEKKLCVAMSAKDKFGRITQLKVFKGSVTI